MKFFKYALLTLISLPAFLYAEGGSVYSRLGAGDLFHSYSARRIGMGELGVSVFDRDFIGSINPASWSKLNLTRFEVAFNFQNLRQQSNDFSAYQSLANFSGATVGIPIERDLGIAAVLGIIPYSNINYSVVQSIPVADYANNITYEGSGNITKTFIGGSYTTPFDVSVGASFDYYIGKADYHSRVEFTNTSLYTANYQKTYKTAGIGGSFGIISNDFAKSLNIASISNLRLGLSVSLASNFNSDTTYALFHSSGVDTITTGKTNSQLPMRLAAGLNFTYKNSLLVTLDYLYQPWNKYKFGEQSAAKLRTLQKLSAGVEYRNPDRRETGFWERTMIRGGLSYEQTQYIVNGQEINEYSVFTGFSFPLDFENTVDIALQYGIRGTTDLNLVKENIFRANVSLSLGELWFFRPQR